jgi:hypothetical protein
MKTDFKITITQEQALEVIKKLKLIRFQSSVFTLASTYCTQKYLEKELENAENEKRKKESEIQTLKNYITQIISAL